MEAARRNMIDVALDGNTIQYPTKGIHAASKIYMQPASDGMALPVVRCALCWNCGGYKTYWPSVTIDQLSPLFVTFKALRI